MPGAKIIISFGLLTLIIAYLNFFHIASLPGWDTDYKYLYFSAQQALHHANIYYPLRFFSPSLNDMTEVINLNPPFVAILMAPLGLMTYTTSFLTWSLLNLVLELSSVFLIVHKFFRPKQERFFVYLLSAFLLLAYFPTFINSYAQTGGAVFFLTTVGWLLFREEKVGAAGFFWGMAFSLKLFIGLFLWMLFWRKEWRAIAIFLLVTMMVAALAILILGTDVYLKYYAVFAKIHWYSVSWNASLLGFFSRLFGYFNEKNIAILNFPQLTLLFYSIAVIIFLSLFIFFKNVKETKIPALTPSASKRMSHDFAVAYTLVAMLLISPLAWIYYFSLLLIPCAIIFYWNRYVFYQQSVNFFLAAALFLSSVPHLLIKPREIVDGYAVFLWSGCYFYALCILAILIFKLNHSLHKGALRKQSVMPSSVLAILFSGALLPSFFGILTIIFYFYAASGG